MRDRTCERSSSSRSLCLPVSIVIALALFHLPRFVLLFPPAVLAKTNDWLPKWPSRQKTALEGISPHLENGETSPKAGEPSATLRDTSNTNISRKYVSNIFDTFSLLPEFC